MSGLTPWSKHCTHPSHVSSNSQTETTSTYFRSPKKAMYTAPHPIIKPLDSEVFQEKKCPYLSKKIRKQPPSPITFPFRSNSNLPSPNHPSSSPATTPPPKPSPPLLLRPERPIPIPRRRPIPARHPRRRRRRERRVSRSRRGRVRGDCERRERRGRERFRVVDAAAGSVRRVRRGRRESAWEGGG